MNNIAAVFILTYMAGYFACAWVHPNVPSSHRGVAYWAHPKNLLLGEFGFRAVFALVLTGAYALWSM